jgi:hypothetical protein
MALYNPNTAFGATAVTGVDEYEDNGVPLSFLPRARKQADAAFERYMELAGGQDDYSQAQMQALRRSEQANMNDRLAIAAQYAGPKFSEMQESYLKRAMAGRKPTRLGNAIIGPDGTVVSDPAANREKQAELQFRLGQHYSQNANLNEQRADRLEELQYTRERNRRLDEEGSISHFIDPNTNNVIFYNKKNGEFFNSPTGQDTSTEDSLTLKPGFNLPSAALKLSDTQDKSRYYAEMMTNALPGMILPLQEGYVPTRKDQVAAGPEATGFQGKIANSLTPRSAASPQGREFYTAGRQILAAILRKESGAAITDDEWSNYGPMYLPWPGDSKDDITRKMEMISSQIDNIAKGSGPAYRYFTPYDGGAIDNQAPEGVPQSIWDNMSQVEKDQYHAAGKNP